MYCSWGERLENQSLSVSEQDLILTLSELYLSPLSEEMKRCNLPCDRSGCGTTLAYSVAPHCKLLA
jgi:hypothetical protein